MFALSALSASGVSGSLLTSHNPPLQFCLSSLLILSGSLLLLGALLGPQVSLANPGSPTLRSLGIPSEPGGSVFADLRGGPGGRGGAAALRAPGGGFRGGRPAEEEEPAAEESKCSGADQKEAPPLKQEV